MTAERMMTLDEYLASKAEALGKNHQVLQDYQQQLDTIERLEHRLRTIAAWMTDRRMHCDEPEVNVFRRDVREAFDWGDDFTEIKEKGSPSD